MIFERNGLKPRIYGPYSDSVGRRRCVLVYPDNFKTTIAYARYLWLMFKGAIPDGYEVDHIDNDFTNDTLENYQLLNKIDNIKKSSKELEIYHGICPICNNKFHKPMCTVRSNWKIGKAGPFCSRKCSGIYGSNIQNNRGRGEIGQTHNT